MRHLETMSDTRNYQREARDAKVIANSTFLFNPTKLEAVTLVHVPRRSVLMIRDAIFYQKYSSMKRAERK